MTEFVHQRHKPPRSLERPRELVLACGDMRSNVNLSRIVRAAGCFGLSRMIACERPKIDAKVARDSVQQVKMETHRSLPPVLKQLRDEGYRLVGLEQTTNSQIIFDYHFARRTVLVVGNERSGLADDVLALVDDVVEIPVYGMPHSFNAATAAIITMYEYCRQFPRG